MESFFKVGDRVRIANGDRLTFDIIAIDGNDFILETAQGARTVMQADKLVRVQRRGFGAMTRKRQAEIASLGGKKAHEKGTAHEFSPDEAREAGRKGGQAAQRRYAQRPTK